MSQQLPDYLRPGLDIVFIGFNPGRRSAAVGHYYAGRGNQFWKLLFESGLVTKQLTCEDDHHLLDFGIGMTDMVKRWSTSSSELRAAEYRREFPHLMSRLREKAPGARMLAFNGKGAYRNFSKLAWRGFVGRQNQWGLQTETFDGAEIFVLPSTSALCARIRRSKKLLHFCELAKRVKRNA